MSLRLTPGRRIRRRGLLLDAVLFDGQPSYEPVLIAYAQPCLAPQFDRTPWRRPA